MNLKNKIKQNILQYKMIENNDTVLLGLSGGADSICLLHILNEIKEELSFNLIAAHINHGIRNEALSDELFCKNICEKLNIPIFFKKVDIHQIAKNNKISEEEAGRNIRYDFFNSLKPNKIVTAHNKNDNVETVLMRLIRGTGLKGLSGIPLINNKIIRPMLNISRKDIENYLNENNISFIIDSTNLKPIYTRNKIRLNVIPYIEQSINPNFINTLGDNICQYEEDSSYLMKLAEEQFHVLNKGNKNKIEYDIFELKKLDISILKRLIIISLKVIKKQIENIGYSSSLDNIINLINNNKNSYLQYGNIIIKSEYNKIIFYREDYDEYYNKTNLNFSVVESNELIKNTEYECFIPLEYIENKKLEYRTKKKNDIVRIDNNRHKKLSKFLIDKKIPKDLRENIKLLTIDNEILMIPYYFSSRFEKRTGKFIKVTIK